MTKPRPITRIFADLDARLADHLVAVIDGLREWLVWARRKVEVWRG